MVANQKDAFRVLTMVVPLEGRLSSTDDGGHQKDAFRLLVICSSTSGLFRRALRPVCVSEPVWVLLADLFAFWPNSRQI